MEKKKEIKEALETAMQNNGVKQDSLSNVHFDMLFSIFQDYEKIYEIEERLEENKDGFCLASALKDTKPFGESTSDVAFDAMCLLRKKDTDGNEHAYTLDEVYSEEMKFRTQTTKDALHLVFAMKEVNGMDLFDRMYALMTLCVYYQIDAINTNKEEKNKEMIKTKEESKNQVNSEEKE